MSSVSVEFTFHGHSFDGVLFSDIPFDDLLLVAQDLIDYIEEDSDK